MTESLLQCVEIEPDAKAERSVIWLHGLGASGNDFAPIIPMLDLSALPPVRFVLPHAPTMPVTLNGGMVMRAWFDIEQLDVNDFRVDEDGVRQAAASIEALIQRELERGVSRDHIVLAGFSQGGAIALHHGVRQTEPLAGILAMSTDLPMPEQAAEQHTEASRKTPVFLAHGSHDPVVVLARGMKTRERLTAMGYEVEWHEYAMQHEVCAEELADLASWMCRVLS